MPGKRSALGSDISDKQIIVYTSTCIEEEIVDKIYQTRILMMVQIQTVLHGIIRIIPLIIN